MVVRNQLHEKLIKGRVRTGKFGSDDTYGHNGMFTINYHNVNLVVMASDGQSDPEFSHGWEHVSVSLQNRCPNWPEMNFVKDLFWEPEETVVQFHPPKSHYINNHPYCLHMWKNIKVDIELPPDYLVGAKAIGEVNKSNIKQAIEEVVKEIIKP